MDMLIDILFMLFLIGSIGLIIGYIVVWNKTDETDYSEVYEEPEEKDEIHDVLPQSPSVDEYVKVVAENNNKPKKKKHKKKSHKKK